jgi:GNAT superfamily N-acetyltransferase
MIRRATADDVESIALIFDRASRAMTYLPVVHTLDEHRAWLGKRVSDTEAWVWDDGGVRGYMLLGADELMHLYLDPGHTGRGIGAELLEHAKARRPGGFHLWTFQPNEGARRFYERHGLCLAELGDGSGNEEGVPDVRYEWRPPAGRGSPARSRSAGSRSSPRRSR